MRALPLKERLHCQVLSELMMKAAALTYSECRITPTVQLWHQRGSNVEHLSCPNFEDVLLHHLVLLEDGRHDDVARAEGLVPVARVLPGRDVLRQQALPLLNLARESAERDLSQSW